MDRNKGIWGIIACIFIVGLAVTFTTSKYITHQEETGQMETTAAAAMESDSDMDETFLPSSSKAAEAASAADGLPGLSSGSTTGSPASDQASAVKEELKAREAVPGETAASGPGLAKAPDSTEAEAGPGAVSPEAEDKSESAASVLVEISPLEGPTATGEAGAQTDLKEYYLTRLNDLEAQIQKMRSEETDSTTYSMKRAAENELKLWDNELNTIYSVILKQMDEEESQKLVEEERAWMKKRDSLATDAAQQYNGGTIESLEYTASLAESTKARAYELAETYFK